MSMNREHAVVTANGIKHGDSFYSCARAIRFRWFEKAWVKGEWEIAITVDQNNPRVIFLDFDDGERREICNTIIRHSESDKKLMRYFESIQKLKTSRKNSRERRKLKN